MSDDKTAAVPMPETAVDRLRARRDAAAKMAVYHLQIAEEQRSKHAAYAQEVADLDEAVNAMTRGGGQ